MRSFVSLTLLAAMGCGGALGAQAAPRDTMVINSLRNVELPKGTVPSSILGKPSYAVNPSEIAHIPHDNAIACDRTGDATLTVWNRVSTRRLLVKCRPIKTFGMFNAIRIDIAKGPVPMPAISNVGWDGQPVRELSGSAQVNDTAVIRLKDGKLTPLKLGRTRVDMNFSGLTDVLGVEVFEQVASGPVTLVGGEMKSWRLPRGRYEINLTPAEGQKTQPLRLSMYRANCAKGREGPHHLHCVTYEEGALILRNTRDPGPKTAQTGNVWVIRQGM